MSRNQPTATRVGCPDDVMWPWARPLRLAPLALLAMVCGCAIFGGAHKTRPTAALGYQYFHNRNFGSPFQTGVPYALAMAAIEHYPEQLGGSGKAFCEKFGIILRPEDPDGLAAGFALHRNGLTGIDFVMTNCSFCHSGQIGGRIVPGLGSRDLRLNALNSAVVDVVARADFNAKTLLPLARAAAKRRRSPWGWRGAWATRTAISQLRQRAGKGMGNAFGGMKDVDGGPGRNSAIEFAKAASNVPIAPPYSFAKYPAVWVYAKRSTFGYDGSIVGDRALALSAVEFNKRMPPKDIVKRKDQWRSVYEYIMELEPPPYPGTVDTVVAAQGREIFMATCSRCHGTYGLGREPDQYREQVIALHRVGTDPDRLHSITPALVEARSKGPLARYVRIEATDGYVAPPLDGIWCRGPYLHNGSVPTLVDLLTPANHRPTKFYVGLGTEYDLERLGLAYEDELFPDGTRAGRRASPRQYPFDTQLAGNHNEGHEFGVYLTSEERRRLLEYLKQL